MTAASSGWPAGGRWTALAMWPWANSWGPRASTKPAMQASHSPFASSTPIRAGLQGGGAEVAGVAEGGMAQPPPPDSAAESTGCRRGTPWGEAALAASPSALPAAAKRAIWAKVFIGGGCYPGNAAAATGIPGHRWGAFRGRRGYIARRHGRTRLRDLEGFPVQRRAPDPVPPGEVRAAARPQLEDPAPRPRLEAEPPLHGGRL